MMQLMTQMVLHDRKSHVASHLDLRNVMVPLFMQWASCNAGAKGMT